MYGMNELRKSISVNDRGYVCPVEGCQTRLQEKQKKHFVNDPKFGCPIHHIVFSPSTFEYEKPEQNMLWGDFSEMEKLTSKRESRVARDNSEDAVTWNVFRFLETNDLLLPYLTGLDGSLRQVEDVVYWSHDRRTGRTWSPLWEARKAFEGNPAKGSEPDLIIKTDGTLFFIEAKITASNETHPSRLGYPKNYTTGGDGWWQKVFATSANYYEIAERDAKYELMRFWLLGTWMAARLQVDFRLINLVLDGREEDIETKFRNYLPELRQTDFLRTTWESIQKFIATSVPESDNKKTMLRYFQEKTIGYSGDGVLQRAFAV